jgi:multiple sugar transport system ATP-binding protein
MGSLSIQSLRKEFDDGQIVAVDDVSIDVADGEFIVIVGPSGCGKSTTLNCVAGLEEPTSGHIVIDDVDVTPRAPQDRDIAMVFQNYALYPHMNVRRNIGFGLRMSTDLSDGEVDSRVDDIAAMLEIQDLLEQKPKELSGGQQQRVALGRAIVREPEVFLMDEPLSNLDAKLRTQMRTEIQRLQNELGITTLYVTHDQTEAMTMGDRIAIMNGGVLQQLATPLEVYHQPANRFVAGFIGSPSMNFFDVQKFDSGGSVSLEHDQFTYALTDTAESVADAPTDLTLGIRPEAIELAEGHETNRFTATVEVVEPMGEVNYVYFSFDEETYTVSLPGQQLVSEGSDVEFYFPEDSIHIFETASGDSLHHPDKMPDVDAFQALGHTEAVEGDTSA